MLPNRVSDGVMPPPNEGICTTLKPLNHGDGIAILARHLVLLCLHLRLFAEDNTFGCWLGYFDRDFGRRVRISRVANPLSRERDLSLAELDTRVSLHLRNECVFNTCMRKIDL